MISYEQHLQFSPYFALQDVETADERLGFLKVFDGLPQKIKELLISMDVTEQIMNTGTSFDLDESDIESVSFMVRKIAAGEIFIGDAEVFISDGLEITRERAKNLLGLIVNEVFAPSLEDIKKVQTEKFPQRFGAAEERVSPAQYEDNIGTGTANPNVINLRNRQTG